MFLSKTSSRHLQDMSSRPLSDMSSRRLQDLSSRLLQRNSFLSSKTSSRRLSRCLQDVLEDETLLCWRRVEDVLKTNKCLLGLLWETEQWQRVENHFYCLMNSSDNIRKGTIHCLLNVLWEHMEINIHCCLKKSSDNLWKTTFTLCEAAMWKFVEIHPMFIK